MKNLTTVPALATFLLLSLAGLPQAIAQSIITKQPTSIVVALGGSATLQVTASATTPLTFQWQFNGADLAGAISNRLTLTNVTLSDLGVYRVIVRDASSQVASQPAALKLARWTQLVAFGSSECMAQYSNGPSWVEDLAGLLCLPTSAIKNYAGGNAGTLEVRSQINQYLSANKPDTNVLLAPWWAGVSPDFWLKFLPVEQVVSNYAMNISLLAQAGGRVFLLPTVTPLYTALFLSSNAYVRSIDYQDLKARMDREVQKLQAEFGLTVFRVDLHDLSVRFWANPTAIGFTNLTSAAKGCVKCDPNQYFWWDGGHFSAAAHRWISQEMYRFLTPPFRFQRCADLATGAWQSDELNFATNATTVSSAPRQYFRVLQLGQ